MMPASKSKNIYYLLHREELLEKARERYKKNKETKVKSNCIIEQPPPQKIFVYNTRIKVLENKTIRFN